MRFTASYQLVRREPLNAKQLAALAKLVRYAQRRLWDGEAFGLVVATAPHPSGVVAKGSHQLSMAEKSWDPNLLCEILDKLQKLFPDAVVNARDDHDRIAVAADGFVFGTGQRRPLVDDRGGTWESVLTLVPLETTYSTQLTAALDQLAAGTPLSATQRTDDKLIAAAYAALAKPEAQHEALRVLLRACDPDVVSRVGFAKYLTLQGNQGSTALLMALSDVRDMSALAGVFVTAWSKPRGLYFYGDLPVNGEFGAAIAAQPIVRDRFIADIDQVEAGLDESMPKMTRDLAYRRCERALVLLGRSKDPRAARRLAASVRRWRGQKTSDDIRYRVYFPALEGLGIAADPAWLPTALLSVEGTTGTGRGPRATLEHALVTNLDLTAPIVRSLLDLGLAIAGCLDAIAKAGVAAASLRDRVEPYLDHPLPEYRYQARAALAAIGGAENEHVEDREFSDPEAHLLHPDLETRRVALHTVHARKDRSLFVALCLTERIDAGLRARAEDYPALPFTWWDWKGIIPNTVIEMRRDDRLAWAKGEGASVIGEQRLPPSIAAIADVPVKDVLATYPSPRIAFDDATRARLLGLEAEALGLDLHLVE